MQPTRNTGEWMENIDNCINRAVPCGNAYCADEAMRSGEIEAGNGVTYQSIYAMEHAYKIADRCEGVLCPLGDDKHNALDNIKKAVM